MINEDLIFNNTYQSGVVTFIAFYEKDKYYGVCLEFDLVTQAKSISEAMEQIKDYTYGWYKNIVINQLSEKLLNKSAPKKYWNKLKEIQQKIENKKQQSRLLKVSPNQLPVGYCAEEYNKQYLHLLN